MIRRLRPVRRWAEIDEKDLVGRVIDQVAQHALELGPAPLAEIAAKYRELQVVAETTKDLEDGRAARIVADVVGDDVAVVHAGGSPETVMIFEAGGRCTGGAGRGAARFIALQAGGQPHGSKA